MSTLADEVSKDSPGRYILRRNLRRNRSSNDSRNNNNNNNNEASSSPPQMSNKEKQDIFDEFITRHCAAFQFTSFSSRQRLSELDALDLVMLSRSFAYHCIVFAFDYFELLREKIVDFYEFEMLVSPTMGSLQDKLFILLNGVMCKMAGNQRSTFLDYVLLLDDCRERIERKVSKADTIFVEKCETYGYSGRFIYQYIVDSIKEILKHSRYQDNDFLEDPNIDPDKKRRKLSHVDVDPAL